MVYICEDILGFDVEEALRVVSAERRDKALRYRFDVDRRQSLAAYMLLCYGLNEEYGIILPPRLSYDDRDKPYLTNYPDIHFNLSHCRYGVACAIGREPIGVDIEVVADIDWDVARRVMSDEQLEYIATSSEPERAFCKLWTTKESLLKRTGEGLCDDLPRLLLDNSSFAHYNGEKYICTACYADSEQHDKFCLVRL